jgi:hypothetical protein
MSAASRPTPILATSGAAIDFGDGVEIGWLDVRRIDAGIARRDRGGAGQCDHQMGIIAAHAAALDKGIGGASCRGAGAGFIGQMLRHPIVDRGGTGPAGQAGKFGIDKGVEAV